MQSWIWHNSILRCQTKNRVQPIEHGANRDKPKALLALAKDSDRTIASRIDDHRLTRLVMLSGLGFRGLQMPYTHRMFVYCHQRPFFQRYRNLRPNMLQQASHSVRLEPFNTDADSRRPRLASKHKQSMKISVQGHAYPVVRTGIFQYLGVCRGAKIYFPDMHHIPTILSKNGCRQSWQSLIQEDTDQAASIIGISSPMEDAAYSNACLTS